MRVSFVLSTLIVGITLPLSAAIKTGTITYTQNGKTFEGFYAYDTAATSKRPGVLIVHQWKGITPHEQQRAASLAKAGYVAFVADIYGKGIRPTSNQSAAPIAQQYKSDRRLLRDRGLLGIATLKKMPQVDPNRIAAIGFCFGGTTVLELARDGAPLKGVVSFHGNLDTPTLSKPGSIKSSVLVLHGADDPYVPVDQVLVFESEMREAKADWQLIKYSGAVHSFTEVGVGSDPTTGQAYNSKADRRSWAATLSFLKEVL